MVWPFGGSQTAATSSPSSETSASSSSFVPDTTNNTDKQLSIPFLSEDVDISQLHPLARLGQDLEVLDLEDDALSDLPGSKGFLPSRGWSDDLCYGSGTMYMGGVLQFFLNSY